jgi:hypothetical protein
VDTAVAAGEVTATLTATLADLGDGDAVRLHDVVLLMCARDPALFTTSVPPLTEKQFVRLHETAWRGCVNRPLSATEGRPGQAWTAHPQVGPGDDPNPQAAKWR